MREKFSVIEIKMMWKCWTIRNRSKYVENLENSQDANCAGNAEIIAEVKNMGEALKAWKKWKYKM